MNTERTGCFFLFEITKNMFCSNRSFAVLLLAPPPPPFYPFLAIRRSRTTLFDHLAPCTVSSGQRLPTGYVCAVSTITVKLFIHRPISLTTCCTYVHTHKHTHTPYTPSLIFPLTYTHPHTSQICIHSRTHA